MQRWPSPGWGRNLPDWVRRYPVETEGVIQRPCGDVKGEGQQGVGHGASPTMRQCSREASILCRRNAGHEPHSASAAEFFGATIACHRHDALSPWPDQGGRLAPGALENKRLGRLAGAWGQFTLLQILRQGGRVPGVSKNNAGHGLKALLEAFRFSCPVRIKGRHPGQGTAPGSSLDDQIGGGEPDIVEGVTI